MAYKVFDNTFKISAVRWPKI